MSSPFQLQDPNAGGIRLVDPSTIQEDRSRIPPESLGISEFPPTILWNSIEFRKGGIQKCIQNGQR